MFRLAHLSDPHLGPLPDVTYRDLASKRITGYVNWHRNRSRHIHEGVIDMLAADLWSKEPDHLAVTGDLVNLALDIEIDLARRWLEALGPAERISVVPGNHDAYVPGAFDKACKAWGRWMTGDGRNAPLNRHAFPYMHVRGPVALIGVSTARATAPFMATGFFERGQARRMAYLLDEAGRQGLFRVILIHHPPVRDAAPAHKRLFGISLFQKTVRTHGAELVLHGHTHLPTLYAIPGKNASVPVLGVAAAGEGSGLLRPLAQYNLVEIDGEPGDWHVHLARHGLSSAGAEVSELAVQTLTGKRRRSRQPGEEARA